MLSELPSGSKSTGQSGRKEKPSARGDAHDSGTKLTSNGTPRRKGKCRKCGINGHWAKECKGAPKEERHETAHHIIADAEQPALMLAQVCNVVRTNTQEVFLNQERVFPKEYSDGSWLLDTGATNHMTGNRSILVSLDESVRGSVCFGDESMVEICGIGAVTITGKNQDHKVYSISEMQHCQFGSAGGGRLQN